MQFENDKPASFFAQYLTDVADIEDLDESARLRFPDTSHDTEAWSAL